MMMNSESMTSLAQSEPEMTDASSPINPPESANSLDNTSGSSPTISTTSNNHMTVDNQQQHKANQSPTDNNNTGKLPPTTTQVCSRRQKGR